MTDKVRQILMVVLLCIALISMLFYFRKKKELESFEQDFVYYAENSVTITRDLKCDEVFKNEAVDMDDIDLTVTEKQELDEVIEYVNVIQISYGDILAYIYPDTSYSSLKYGVGHISGTAELGETGNCAIAGHSSTKFSCVFNALADIRLFERITIFDGNGVEHTYYIINKYITDPDDIECLSYSNDGSKILTLVTCVNNGRDRLIIVAKELDDYELSEYMIQHNDTKLMEMLSVIESIDIDELLFYSE